MKKLFLATLIFLTAAGLELSAQSSEVIRNYINRFKDIAIEEMQRTGVPASITLAQGIHETGAGTSSLVNKSNNHFGIKCKTEWTGGRVYHDDDARGECFRKYDDPIQSYKDHSDFLKYRPYYASLFKLDPLDYKGWAYGLKKAGYATNPKYPQILIKLIEDYNLQDYSLVAMNQKAPGENGVIWASNKTAVNSETSQMAKVPKKDLKQFPAGVFKINNTKVVVVPAGTSYLKIAQEHRISLSRLFDFNDMKEEEVTAEDRLIYIQRKRKVGSTEFHIVAEGETIYDIAQSEGIRLDILMAYNQLEPGMMVKAGEKVFLQDEATQLPEIIEEESPVEENKRVEEKKVQPTVTPRAEKEAGFFIHKVEARETVFGISKKYGITIEELKKWNDLKTTVLKIGQELRIKKTK